MVWKRDIAVQLSALMDANDIQGFGKMLQKNLDNLYSDDGTDYYMKYAALNNKFDFLKVFWDLGADVNRSSDTGSKSSPFYQPEGPILWAASEGNYKMVKWL